MSAPEMTDALAIATHIRDRGWRPIPIEPRGKRPAGGGWAVKAASIPTDQMLHLWFGNNCAERNVGIACKPSQLLVVDEDTDEALTAFANLCGETLPVTYRVRTRKGWHWYFDASEYPELGNSPGELGAHGMDVRGGGTGEGGYVLAAGSVHPTGHVYAAEDDYVLPAMLPAWLAEAIERRPVTDAGPGSTPPPAEGWTDEPRYGTAVDLHAQYQRHLNGVRTPGGQFRHELYLAALDGWRLADLGLVDEDTVLGELAAQVRKVWGADPDERDRHIVYAEARAKATSSPWVLRDPPAPGADSSDEQGSAPTAEEIAARRLATALDEGRMRRQVRRLLDAEERPAVPDLDELIVWDDELERVPPPIMAIKQLIPEGGVGWLGGPSGSYKSFVAVSLAACLAYGVRALGHDEFTVRATRKVLYVAGEGSAGVALRMRALRAHFEVQRDRQVALYPRAVDLTNEDSVERLASFVVRNGIEHVVVDTFRQSTIGVNENDNTEVGVILARLIALRDEHGIGSTLVDHTNKSAQGLADLGGAGAKRANVDYVLMVDLPNGSRAVTEQRTLRVAKLKDSPDGRTWPIRLEQVDEVVDGDGASSAVAIVGEVAVDAGDIHGGQDWHLIPSDELPGAVQAVTKYASAVRDVYRALLAVDDETGLTQPQLRSILDESPRKHPKTSFYGAIGVLKREGIVAADGARLRLAERPER